MGEKAKTKEGAVVQLPIRTRPTPTGWVLVVMFALFGIGSPTIFSGVGKPHWPGFLMAALCLTPSVLYGIWMARACIIADETGLRWRHFGGWRSAAWAEVMDYYDHVLDNSQRQTGPEIIIETTRGKWKTDNGLWRMKDFAVLRQIVAQKANESKVNYWTLLGAREIDWPRTFRYDTPSNVWTFRFLILAMVSLVCLFAPKVASAIALLGWIWGLAFAGLLCVVLLAKAFLALYLYREVSLRWKEFIVVSSQGVTLTNKNRTIMASWGEITDYYIRAGGLSHKLVVVTTHGTFDFMALMADSAVLRTIITRQAKNVAAKEWRSLTDEETLGGEGGKWSSGRVGVGERVYHYRTRYTRSMLWLPSAISLMPALMYALGRAGLTLYPASGLACGIVTLLIGLPTLWGWYRYWTASVRTSDNGITYYGPFGKKFVAGAEVQEYRQTGESDYAFGHIRGSHTRIKFWLNLSGRQELTEEIETKTLWQTKH